MAMVLLNASQKATDAAFNAMNTAIKENKPELISETSSGPGADLTSKKDELKEKKPKQQKKSRDAKLRYLFVKKFYVR